MKLTLILIFPYYAVFNVFKALFSTYILWFVIDDLQKRAIIWIQLELEDPFPSAETTIQRNKASSPPVKQAQKGLDLSRLLGFGRLRQLGILAAIGSHSFTTGSFNTKTRSSSIEVVLATNHSTNEVMAVWNHVWRITFSFCSDICEGSDWHLYYYFWHQNQWFLVELAVAWFSEASTKVYWFCGSDRVFVVHKTSRFQ